MAVKPRNGLIMVRKFKSSKSKDGVILLVKEQVLDHGIVLDAGPGEWLPDGTFRAVQVVPGDEVITARGAGIVLDINDEPILFVTQQDIEAIIRKGDREDVSA